MRGIDTSVSSGKLGPIHNWDFGSKTESEKEDTTELERRRKKKDIYIDQGIQTEHITKILFAY